MSEATKQQILERRGLKIEPDFLWGDPRVVLLGRSLLRPKIDVVSATVPDWQDGEIVGEKSLPAARLVFDGEEAAAAILLPRFYLEQFAGMLSQHLHFHPSDFVVRMGGHGEGMSGEAVDFERPEHAIVDEIGVTKQLGVGGNPKLTRLYFRNDLLGPEGAALGLETPTKWLYLARDAALLMLLQMPPEEEKIVRLKKTDGPRALAAKT